MNKRTYKTTELDPVNQAAVMQEVIKPLAEAILKRLKQLQLPNIEGCRFAGIDAHTFSRTVLIPEYSASVFSVAFKLCKALRLNVAVKAFDLMTGEEFNEFAETTYRKDKHYYSRRDIRIGDIIYHRNDLEEAIQRAQRGVILSRFNAETLLFAYNKATQENEVLRRRLKRFKEVEP